jgi:NAD(P)-dependent dehydrogenase (short-subunit alcohol dehydrogenase family)
MAAKRNMFEDLLSLEGKVAVITGAASGIGRATAELLAAAGAAAALIDIDQSGGKETAARITRGGGRANFFFCDVTSDSDCKKAAAAIHQQFGRVDILFNNAGIIRRKSIVELSEADWDLVIDVGLKAVFLLSRYVIPIMKTGGGGAIINIGSGWGLKGGPRAAAYCAAKAGVVNLTRAMAIDHGRQGIRVNCICPGDIDTPLLRGEAAELGVAEEEFMKMAADRPIPRVGVPEDIARAVLFLATDLSAWVTGTSVLVDGGGLA